MGWTEGEGLREWAQMGRDPVIGGGHSPSCTLALPLETDFRRLIGVATLCNGIGERERERERERSFVTSSSDALRDAASPLLSSRRVTWARDGASSSKSHDGRVH